MAESNRSDTSSTSKQTAIVVEDVFRRESGRLTAMLLSVFGLEYYNTIEDAVQESLLRALNTWPYYGVPVNPAGWLYQTARRLIIDSVRHDRHAKVKKADIAAYQKQLKALPEAESILEDFQRDSQLRVLFICAHPRLSQDLQLALTLKMIGGFGVAEISHALLASPDAIKRRIGRALATLRSAETVCELPAQRDLPARINTVLTTIYLMFNEGYKAARGHRLMRPELCYEAIRLAELLPSGLPGERPTIDALLSLMYLNLARFPARTADLGYLLPMEDQDRTRWDQSLIARGILHLIRSSVGNMVSRYHIEAAIAACHCAASEYQLTDWQRILQLYDQLATLVPTPIVRLNRSVAIYKACGSHAALDVLNEIEADKAMAGYYLFHAVRAEFLADLGDHLAACEAITTAMTLCQNRVEYDWLVNKRQRLTMPR